MPSWRRTKLLSGLYDEPVSEHLQHEVADFGSAAQLHAARTDETGIPALEAWLGEARGRLDSGEGQVLCVVDIYNEGVDVPNVNTLFFFRPTESATVFLQQLGRGLRRAPGIRPKGLPKAASGARLWSAARGSAGGKMPEVSRFFGILISINYNDHAPPHFHVR